MSTVSNSSAQNGTLFERLQGVLATASTQDHTIDQLMKRLENAQIEARDVSSEISSLEGRAEDLSARLDQCSSAAATTDEKLDVLKRLMEQLRSIEKCGGSDEQ